MSATPAAALRAVKRFRFKVLAGTPATSTDAIAIRTVTNPFVPRKNPESGRWAPPRYSLRQQADLVKKARASGTLHLLPPGPKLGVAELARYTSPKPAETQAESMEESTKPAEMPAETAEERTEEWAQSVEWNGAVRERNVAGADVGNRLYAGKKRMFKGHKWERVRAQRVKRTRILLRDMDKRVRRYKSHHARRRPKPLMPAMDSKRGQRLPF